MVLVPNPSVKNTVSSPIAKSDNFQALTKARANENICWLVACVGAGKNRGNVLQGYSAIVDPDGTMVACGPRAAECIVKGEIDVEQIYKLRKTLTVYEDRALPI